MRTILRTAVMGGETIHVPESNRRVLALGHVQRPGAYPLTGTHASWTSWHTGGPTDNADLTEATLARIILEAKSADRYQGDPG